MRLTSRFILPAFQIALQIGAASAGGACRNQPGDPGFPSPAQWGELSAQVGGRLVQTVPSAQFCHSLPAGNCTEDGWQSTTFRASIPGAMDSVNWEQDYLSRPPSLCLQNGTTCEQGNVPLYAVNATSAADIQAGVKFAVRFNLRVAVKASGHDFLGRSTAKNALLLWTHQFRNISFTESFFVGGKNVGSTVTVGSGVPLNAMYAAAKAQGKMFVGGSAATVVAAGGYAQGAGHSAFSPALGLAADNALEYQIVIANGSLVTANVVVNPDLFWALRGGGAGSWGVIISGTFRTFAAFNATLHTAQIAAPTNASTGALLALHARHIFDWDSTRAGQYFYAFAGGAAGNLLALATYFANATVAQAEAAMAPLLDDARAAGFAVAVQSVTTALATDLLFNADDALGVNAIMGSRLVPAEAYRSNAAGIGQAYTEIFEQGIPELLGHLVAGGQVADNANISSAVNPKWRTAKTHIIAVNTWDDSVSPATIESIKESLTKRTVPILARITGEPDSGAYSNEADVREPDFQTTFFGANYARLRVVKENYDPESLFIVGAGVGSEEWDQEGLCRI